MTLDLTKKFASGEYNDLVTCWKLKLRNGDVMGFTEFDCDLQIDEVSYSARSGFTRSAIENNSNLKVDNLEVEAMIDHEKITAEAILRGDFDFAEVTVFLVSATAPQAGIMVLRTGWIGEVSSVDGRFSAEIRGLLQSFAQSLCQTYSPQCRASLGDNKCKKNVESHTYKAKVLQVLAADEIIIDMLPLAADYFRYGTLITNLHGKDARFEIVGHENSRVLIRGNVENFISVGSEVTLIAGCDRNLSTCIKKFDNAINFRGEPFVPQSSKYVF